MFHRAVRRAERKLDDNEQAQKRLQREQDGSEVKSVQLERLIEHGRSLIERRDSLESSATAPPTTTFAPPDHLVPAHRLEGQPSPLTAAMIDSPRLHRRRRKRRRAECSAPGPKIALTGGAPTDHRLIWAKLDQVHAKHPTWC